jgi:hypothetical protein
MTRSLCETCASIREQGGGCAEQVSRQDQTAQCSLSQRDDVAIALAELLEPKLTVQRNGHRR